MLYPVLSPGAKYNLCPDNIVDIRGNDTHETGILFCSREDTRPPDVRLSTAHLPPHTNDNGCGFYAALPRFLSNNRRFFRIHSLDEMLFRTRTLVHLELHVLQKNIVPESSCYSQIILFMRSSMHCQTTKHTEIVIESIQRIQTFLGPQLFWQTPFPHMQRLVVLNYFDLDRHIAIECIFCVGPSECFIFQACSFLSLYPASCLLQANSARQLLR